MPKSKFLLTLILDGLLLLPVVTLAAYLRLANLPNNPGWYPDEGTLITLAANLLQGKDLYLGLTPGLLMAGRMPLFIWILAGAFRLFGVEIGVLRALTGSLGVLCVVLLYTAVRRLAADRALAWLAALTLAIYPMAVVYSRTGFSYNLLAVWAVLLFWACGEFLANPCPGWLLLASCAAGLAVISEISGVVLLPVLLLVVSVRAAQVQPKTTLLAGTALVILPVALVFLSRWAAAPEALLFDVHYLTSRVNGIPLLAQIPFIFINLAAMMDWDSWTILGLAGLFILPLPRLRRLLLAAWLAPLVLVARTVGLTGLGYYYAIPFLPFAALGAAGLLRFGAPAVVHLTQQDAAGLVRHWSGRLPAASPAVSKVNPREGTSVFTARLAVVTAALTAALLVGGPLLYSTFRTASQVSTNFQTPNDWVMIDPAGARQAANFINVHARSNDLVIASPGMAWLVHTRVTDFQITLAASGQTTTHFPGNFAPGRFAYDCRTAAARFVVVDRFWRNWAAPRMAGTAALLEQVTRWPTAFSSGEYTVYINPAWEETPGQK